MLFKEKSVDGGFEYTCADVFGKLSITSDKKLGKQVLDALVSVLPKTHDDSGVVDTEEYGPIRWTFRSPTPVSSERDIFDLVPDLKEGTTVEQLITAIVASMSDEQRDRFRRALQDAGRLVDDNQ